MAAAMAFALRRTSARVVLAVGAFGLLWTGWAIQPWGWNIGKGAVPLNQIGPYEVLGAGFSPWDVTAAALVLVAAIVAAVALYRASSEH